MLKEIFGKAVVVAIVSLSMAILCSYSSAEAANFRVIDDDGYAGSIGTYSGGGESDPTYTMNKTGVTPAPPNNYFSVAEINFVHVPGGWQGFYLNGSGVDVSANDYLTFYVYSSQSNTTFEVGVKSGGGTQKKVNIASYLPNGANTSWQKVNIPLSDFSGVTWTNLTEYLSINNPNKSATIRICQAFYTRQSATKLRVNVPDTTVGVGIAQRIFIEAVDNNDNIDFTWAGDVNLTTTGSATFSHSNPLHLSNGRYAVSITDNVLETVSVGANYVSGTPSLTNATSVNIQFIASANTRIIDDDGYAGTVSVYSGGGASNPTYTMNKKDFSPALPNNYLSCAEISFVYVQGGWQVWSLGGSAIDVSTTDYLSFYVYSNQSNTTFSIGVKSSGGSQATVPITNYLASGANTTWQKVHIPLSAFSGVTWSSLIEYFDIINPNKTATVRVAQVFYTKQGATKLAIEIPDATVGVGQDQSIVIKAIDNNGNIDYTWAGTVDLSATGDAAFEDLSPITLDNGRYTLTISDETVETVTVGAEYASGPQISDATPVNIDFIAPRNTGIIDDYFPDTWQEASFRGIPGAYAGGGASAPTYTMAKKNVTPAPPNNFRNVAEVVFTYVQGGWQVWDLQGDALDVSTSNYLTFYVYSSQSNTEFSIGVKSFGGEQVTVPITNYLANGANTTWQKVNIPLSDFEGVNWWNLIEYFSLINPNKSATVRVCQVYYTKSGATKLKIEIPDTTIGVAGIEQRLLIEALDDYDNIDFTWSGTVNLTKTGDAVYGDSTPITLSNGRYATTIKDNTLETVTLGANYNSGTPSLTNASTVNVEFIPTANIPVIDDYIEGTWQNNGYIGYVGVYSGGDLNDPTYTMDKTGVTPTPPNNFEKVAEVNFTYSANGWQSWTLHGDVENEEEAIDVSKCNYLTFYVYSSQSNTEFKIGIKDWEDRMALGNTVPITDYLPSGANTTWQKVNIPLADFGVIDLANVIEYISIRDINKTATIRICQAYYTKKGATKLDIEVPDDTVGVGMPQQLFIKAIDDYGNIDFTWQGSVNLTEDGSAVFGDSNPISFTNGRFAVNVSDNTIEDVNVGAEYVSGTPSLSNATTELIHFISPQSVLLIDDYFEDTWKNAGYRGIVGTYAGNGASDPTFTMDKTGVTPAPPNNFTHVAEIVFTYVEGGWQTWNLHGGEYDDIDDCIDVSTADYLTFYVWASVNNTTFKVGVKDWRGKSGIGFTVNITEYLANGAGTTWQKVNIPLEDFGDVDWSHLIEYFSIRDPNQSATIRIAQVAYTKQGATKLRVNIPYNITTENIAQVIYIEAVDNYNNIDFTWSGTVDVSATGSATLSESNPITITNGRYALEANDTMDETSGLDADYVSGTPTLIDSAVSNIEFIADASADSFEIVDRQLFINGSQDPHLIKGVDFEVTKIGNGPTERAWFRMSKDAPHKAWVDTDGDGVQDAGEDAVGDFYLMQQMGVNTIRMYSLKDYVGPEYTGFATADPVAVYYLDDAYDNYGIKILAGHMLGMYEVVNQGKSWTDNEFRQQIHDEVMAMVNAYKDQPFILAWVLGNEPNWVIRNDETAARALYGLVQWITEDIHEADPKHPVVLCNGWFEYADIIAGATQNPGTINANGGCANIDIYGWNSYSGMSYQFDINKLNEKFPTKPGIITELGCDAWKHDPDVGNEGAEDQASQARFLSAQWNNMLANMLGNGKENILGVSFFEYMDEWWKSEDPGFSGQSLSPWTHDTPGGWYNGTYAYDPGNKANPDKFYPIEWQLYCNFDEEHWGIFAQGNDDSDIALSPLIRRKRQAYDALKQLWNPTDPDLNFALNKTATASSALSGYEAGKAIDGNTQTKWQSQATNSEWLKVDLGEYVSLNRIVLNWAQRPRAYQILAYLPSEDLTEMKQGIWTWQEVYSTSVGKFDNSGTDDVVVYGIPRVKEIKINCTDMGWDTGFALSECEFYFDEDGSISNYALNRPVTVSLEDADAQGYMAVDRFKWSDWWANSTSAQWLKVDLGSTKTINEIYIDWKYPASEYEIKTSPNDLDWTTVYATDIGNGDEDNIVIPAKSNVRYVKINCNAAAGTAGYSIRDMKIYNDPNAEISSLSYNKTATASSQLTNYEAGKAVDSDTSTRWESDSTNDEWIYVDLGSERTINTVILNWEYYAKAYKVQVSTNGSDWTDVYVTYTIGQAGIDSIVFPEINARYVRILGIERGSSEHGYSLKEIEVYYNPEVRVSNYALNCTVTASSYLTNYEASKAVDGNMETQWTSENSDPQNITLDFGTALKVNKVILEWDSFARSYNIEVSTNGFEWTEVYWTSVGNGQTDTVIFPAKENIRYVRINGKERGVPYGYSLKEIGVYYEKNGKISNLAYNKTATASSESTNYEASKAVDANVSTRWGSSFSDTEWIKVDLGTTTTFNVVELKWESAYGSAYKIQVSTNGTDWTDVFYTTIGRGDEESIAFAAQEARYVRMQGVVGATGWGYSLWEFAVFYDPTIDLSNFALDATATASSGSGDYAADKAIDGDKTNTRWGSDYSDPQWIKLDLGAVIPINKVVLNWEAAYGKTYVVEISTNDSDWTEVYSSEGYGQPGENTIYFPADNARYVRMYGTERGTGYGYSLWEFEVYYDPMTSVKNLSIGKTAYASSVEGSGNEADKAIDTDLTTRWSSGFSDNQWITVDLGYPQFINRAVLRWEAAYGKTYKIQVSLDESTWTDVYSINDNENSQVDDISFETQNARYVRMNATLRGTGYGYSLWEFETYYDQRNRLDNLALDKVTAASSVANNNEAYNATDGSVRTVWESNPQGSNPQWIKVDMGTSKTVNKVHLYWGTNYAGSYKVQVSANDTDWTDVYATSTTAGSGIDDVVFDSQSARYVRIYLEESGTGSGYSLWEFGVYNDANAAVSNFALDKTADCSSSQTEHEAGKAVDGSSSTTWRTTGAGTEWLSVDLSAVKNINKVAVRWGIDYARVYAIQLSSNGTDWSEVYSTSTGHYGVDEIVFPNNAARYVRIYATSSGTGNGYEVKELEVYYDTHAQLSNLAYGKSVTASSTSYGSTSYVTDGNPTTRWSSNWWSPEWIYVDLGSSRKVNKTVIKWEAAYGKDYIIQVSNNASDWEDVHYECEGNGGTDSVIFPEETARYVRMYGIVRATGNGYSMYEFEAYYDANAPVSDMAQGKTVTASSVEVVGYEASKVVDGNPTTRWSSEFSDPQWIYVDLGEAKLFNNVLFKWENGYARSYKVQVSDNATDWTDVYETTTGSGVNERIVFPGQTARYVRMLGSERATAYSYSLWEFGVYYDPTLESIINIAYNQTVTASSQQSGSEASKAVDASLSTEWESSAVGDQWLKIDFGSVRNFNKFIFRWGTNYAKSYSIQTSTDDTTWHDIYSTTTSGGDTDIIALTFKSGRYIKINCTERAVSAEGFQLKEIEVYNDPNAAYSNLAIWKTVSASSEGAQWGYGAGLAVDNNFDSRWGSDYNDEEWFTVHLGTPMTINKIVLRWFGENYGKTYEIKITEDYQTWTTIYETTTGDGADDVIVVPPVTAKGVSMVGHEQGGEVGYSLKEFEIYYDLDIPDPNLARNKTVVASSYLSGYEPEKAVDGFRPSTWDSNATDSEWIYVDLGEATLVNKVIVDWGADYGQSYEILASNDAENWTMVYDTTFGNGGTDTAAFSTRLARYIKMQGVDSGTSSGYSIREFEVQYDAEGGTPNLAFEQPTEASSELVIGRESDKAVDGSMTSSWASDATNTEWIYVDIGDYRTINKAVIEWNTDYGKSYRIDISENASQWTEVYSTTNGDGGTDTITFTPAKARYVRMYGTESGTGNGFSIKEFRVYYDSSSLGMSSRMTINLCGTWQLEPGEETTKPTEYNYTLSVPGLVDMASPTLNWVTEDYFWYKKVITLTPEMAAQHAFIKIDLSKYGTEVWLNDTNIGEYIGNYTSHVYDATSAINYNGTNTLLVRVGQKGTLPEGSVPGTDWETYTWTPGIWGDVSLILTGNVKIDNVQTIPHIDTDTAEVKVTLKNLGASAQDVILYLRAYEKALGTAASNEISDSYSLTASEERVVTLNVPITDPTLWSPENPFLYKMVSRVVQSGNEIDKEHTVFGMREFKIQNNDFYLNGNKVFLKGSNIVFHRFLTDPNRGGLPWDEDWIKSVLIDIPKENNMNFFRAHLGHMYNKWYDIADEYGIMLQDEWMFWTWVIGSHYEIEAEFKQWLKDNWNHPSIVIWDPVNEPGWGTGAQEDVEWLLYTLVPVLKNMDSTRPYEQVDFKEMHPYLYSYQPVLGPDGYMDDMFLENQPDAFNEDLWFWFEKDGDPTFLTVPVMPRWLGSSSTPDERYAFQALIGREVIELWRRKGVDQIAPFGYFGNDGGATSNWFLGDYEDLQTKPIVTALKDAFAPFGVSIEVWDRHFFTSGQRGIDVYVFNDYPTAKTGTLYCKIVDGSDNTVVDEGSYAVNVSAGTTHIEPVTWTMPSTAGTYYLKAYLIPTGESEPVATSKKVTHVFSAVTAPGNLTNAKIMVYDPDDEIYDYLSTGLGLNYVSNFNINNLPSEDILILGEGALKDANYSSRRAAITDFIEAGHSVIVMEPSYNCSGTSTETLQVLDEIYMDVMGASYRGNESYVFWTDEYHPVWDSIDKEHLKMFNGGWGGEAVSPYDVEVRERVVNQAKCGKDLAIPALTETVWGDGVLVFSRIEVRGRLTEDSDPGTDLYSRRVDPVAQKSFLNLLSVYLDTDTVREEIESDLRELPLYSARTVSATVKSNDGNRSPAKAADMNMTTRWESGWSEPQWITLDLGRMKQINRVKLEWETAYAKSYRIEVSANNINWTTVYETTSGDGWTDDITFDPVYCRYVRLYCIERALPDVGFSLYEFGAYYDIYNQMGTVAFDETSYTGTETDAVITLVDDDLNTDPYSQQTVNVNVYSTKDPAGITMTLTEINNDSDTFTSTATSKDLGFSELESDDTNEIIRVSEGSVVTVSYSDASPEGTQKTGVLWNSGRNSTNLALSQTATASSQESGEKSAAKAIDGDVSTRWSSATSDPQWIYVDLGEAKTFNTVILDWESAYAISYKIQISDNATDWTDIYTTTTGDGYVDEIDLTLQKARYVRMYGTVRGTEWGYSLWEFGIYYIVPDSANTALYRIAEASSEDTGASGQTVHVNDGDVNTRWASDWSDPQWVTIDLGYTRTIDKVLLKWEGAYASSYKIQVSTDNQNWTDAYTTTTGNGGTDAIYFTAADARYVRMYGTVRGTQWGYSIYEFEAYNVTQGDSATASSFEGSGNEADKAIDGDYSTRWSSQANDNEWMYIDLGSVQQFDKVVLTWESAYASEYSIQVSNNASDWTTVYTTDAGAGGTEAVDLSTKSARYIKMLGIDRATGWGYSLWEMEVAY